VISPITHGPSWRAWNGHAEALGDEARTITGRACGLHGASALLVLRARCCAGIELMVV